MGAQPTPPPDLEKRFLEPPGWQWQTLEQNSRKLRFGYALPDKPTAIVICLPGLSEYCEKYFETTRDLLSKNYGVLVLDWMGQGLSDRYIKDSQKRHIDSFQQDVDDLAAIITTFLSIANDQAAPLVMLAHSMGCNVGLNYLYQNPETFKCATFSAPMIGIQALNLVPGFILSLASHIFGKSYVTGGTDWNERERLKIGDDKFSSDPTRSALHNLWMRKNPDLQIGNVTFKWLHEAALSCAKVQSRSFLKTIQPHCLFALAGQETLVDNNASKKAAKNMPNVKIIEFPEARHEILMERDEFRDAFLEHFYQLIEQHGINRQSS